ncbi:MAG TPA: hypothetical protein VIK86_07725 [Candidatus Paceibacterota bacterium]
MNLFKKHIEYWKDNPNGYWFKRKLYGWGWTPVKWQGWFVIAIFLLFILVSSFDMKSNSGSTYTEITWFLFKVVLSVIILIFICYKKGEKLKWQWGLKNPKI